MSRSQGWILQSATSPGPVHVGPRSVKTVVGPAWCSSPGACSWVGPFGTHSPWISDCKHIISVSRPARAGPSSHPTPNSVIHSPIHPGSVSHPGWLDGLLRRGLQEREKGGLMLRSKHTLHVPGPARVYKMFTVEAEATVLISCGGCGC